MNYETVKKLLEAGFPFRVKKENSVGVFYGGSISCTFTLENGGKEYFIPLLSELIGACGDRFYSLKLNNKSNDLFKWVAESTVIDFKAKSHYVCAGETPEIALTNLWLALNEKKV